MVVTKILPANLFYKVLNEFIENNYISIVAYLKYTITIL